MTFTRWLRPFVRPMTLLGFISYLGGEPTARAIALVEPQKSAAVNPTTRENLALDKPATASSTQDDSKWAGAAFDGDTESRWCADGGSTPQWVQVDLGRREQVTGYRITWEQENSPYQYQVEGSTDGKTWRMLHDATKSTEAKQIQVQSLTPADVRHVRLTVTGAAEGAWASLFEFEVFGTEPAPAVALRVKKSSDPQSILKQVKVPDGFKASVFAAPPDVNYPTCLTVAPTGEVFVGIDENGSLDAKAKRGRVVRCVDTDRDGKADKFNDFATMDSPRGLVWDAGTLYVLHPPTLTAFRDTDGDGTADRSDVLISGIGFGLEHRGADHTTNGIRLGVDGYLYVAVGDYGFVKAEGKDGGPVQMLGGGIARVRTDGTGLELVSRGQRNIYDVAIDPRMNLFTRDNTNDGDGWDVRLTHVVPTGHYGYPSLFKRFTAETLPPLADYGGGSPCGSIFLQEPGFPKGFGDTLYTCEWGRGAVFMHPLEATGATFKAGQETFVTIPSPTDIDVDGSGQIFISSWHDGSFNYSKPNVGYVIRVVPPDFANKPFPDLAKQTPSKLIEGIKSDSTVHRMAAQRELLRREMDAPTVRLLESAVETTSNNFNGRVAALFTLAQAVGPEADAFLVRQVRNKANLAEFAITAIGDRRDHGPLDPQIFEAFKLGLDDSNPRVRLATIVAIGRLRLDPSSWASPLISRTTDESPVVAHAAVKGLVKLKAALEVVQALKATTGPAEATALARVLGELHDPSTIEPLSKLASESNSSPIVGQAAFDALCRLDRAEALYEAGQWWGTRPDTSGPYYKPVAWSGTEAVDQALKGAVKQADANSLRGFLNTLIREKIDFEETTSQAMKLANDNPTLRASVVDFLTVRPQLSPVAIGFLTQVANNPALDIADRTQAIRGLIRHASQAAARDACVEILANAVKGDNPPGDLVGAWTDFTRDNRQARDLARYMKLAEGKNDEMGTLAYGVLIAVAGNEKTSGSAKADAEASFRRGWTNPELTPRLLRAIGLTRVKTFGPQVKDLLTRNETEIHQAAAFAADRLGIATNLAKNGSSKQVGKPIAATPYETVLADALVDKGDVTLGTQLFERQGCVNCHAITKTGPIKGPYLGDVAARYNRAELIESILKPSAKIAQGFETQRIALNDGRTIEGFVVREAGDEVELRNSTGAVVLVPKTDIEERAKGELSVMPQGLMDPLTAHDLASILAYFESIKGK